MLVCPLKKFSFLLMVVKVMICHSCGSRSPKAPEKRLDSRSFDRAQDKFCGNAELRFFTALRYKKLDPR